MTVAVLGFDPLRDKSYRATTLGRDVADSRRCYWQSWMPLRLAGKP